MISCAIHQPNFFPRPSTLAKLLQADVWVVLDNVQFNARDYQHRTRLAALADPTAQQWLSLPVSRPNGRASLISELRLADRETGRRRVEQLIRQYYRRAPYWSAIGDCVEKVGFALEFVDGLSEVAEQSTLALLSLLGWQGRVERSSALEARCGRSVRLADLTKAVGAETYVCGPGGSRYLDKRPFTELGISVSFQAPPPWTRKPETRAVSALRVLASYGPEAVREWLAPPVHLSAV
ncbi:WbqC family protein [Amycolatopsis pigmentata]|uniref:WbqC family protein n=1 Tax=Amycolatopsis pigmentata TaxID=450801 RepID=A0ABW5FNV9_9PSEU